MPATTTSPGTRVPLVARIGIVMLIVLGAAVYMVQKSLATAEAAKLEAGAALKARTTASPTPAAQQPVFVVVVSDPLEATVKATWSGGGKVGTAPLSLETPRNAKLHLEISKPGYLPYQTELLADAAQTFTARLTAVAVASTASAPQNVQTVVKNTASPKKKKKRPDLPNDGLFDIEDALK